MKDIQQIPKSCSNNDLKNTRFQGILVTIFLTIFLIFLIFQIKNNINIILMFFSYLIGLFLIYYYLGNYHILFKHLIITKDGFYQAKHNFPFSKCDSLFNNKKIIKWNDIDLYVDLKSIVIVWVKKKNKKKLYYLSFRNKEEMKAKERLLMEFKIRGIKKDE